MTYNPNFPADDGQLADFPPGQREQIRALMEDMIVNALKVQGLEPGNASGNIPVSNGTKCVNLNADQLDGKDSAEFAPAGWIPPVATGSSNGSMSNTDKQKLDGITAGAEPNQNAFSAILVGETAIQADGKSDTLEMMAGAGTVITPDATNDRLTFGIANNGVAADQLAANAVTDAKIGSRTITDIVTAGAEPGTLTAKLSQLGYMIKNITGKSNWYTLPAMTLEAISSLFGMSGHSHNGTEGQGPQIAYTNISGTPTSLPANGGNAATANKLATARTINGVTFDGSANITVTAAANGGNADTVGGYTAAQLKVSAGGMTAASLNTNGYVVFVNGFIMQWLYVSDDDVVRSFPIAFPNACFGGLATMQSNLTESIERGEAINILNKAQFKVKYNTFGGQTLYIWAWGC